MRKTNKLLSLLVVSVSAFGLMTNSKAAAMPSCTGEEKAKIGTTCYATLKDAVDSVSSTEATTIVLQDDDVVTSLIAIKDKHNITIDLNEKTVSRASAAIFSVEGGTLTLTGRGTVKITDVNNTNAAIQVLAFGTDLTKLVIDENVTVRGFYAVGVFGSRSDLRKTTNTEVTIRGTLEGDSYSNYIGSAFTVEGRVGNTTGGAIDGFKAPVITIESTAKLTAPGTAIYQAGDSDITINGAYVEGKSGIIVKAGKLKLNNAKIHATGENKTTEGNVGGFTTTGAAIQVESNNNYAGNVEVVIDGGEYISDQGYVFNEYLASGASATNVVDIEITKGTFKSNSTDGNALSVSPQFTAKYKDDSFIAAGTVFTNNDEPAEDVLVYTSNLGISESGIVGEVHSITVEPNTNGTVSTNVKDATEGEEITITATAKDGYKLDKYVVTDEDGKEVTVTYGKFKMPAKDVTVKAVFVAIPADEVASDNVNTYDGIVTYVAMAVSAIAVIGFVSKKVFSK